MASDAERSQLENHIHKLLLKNDGVILLNSFWSSFQSVYHTLPEPKEYGLRKRNDLLSLFPSVCNVDDGAHVNSRKVWVKGRAGKKKAATARTTTAHVTESATGLPQAAVGKAAAQQQEQKVKVKQSKEKLTDNVVKSKRAQQESLTKHNPIAQKERESVAQSLGKPDKLSARPEKPPPSTKGKEGEASKSPIDQVNGQNSSSSLTEPAKMTSWKRENTHVRFDDDAVGVVPAIFQQVPPQMLPPHARGGPHRLVSPPQTYPVVDYNRSYPPLSHVPQGRPHWHPRPPMPYVPQPQQLVSRVSDEQMKNVVDDSIDRLVESKQYVSLERIEKLIIQQFHVSSIGELGFRNIDSIPAVRDHQRMLCKVNASIQAFVKVRSIATVFELGECLKEYAGDGRDFDALRLGPLVTQPLIYEFFKMPSDADVPSVQTEEIFEHLRGFLGANNLWTDRNVQLEDFMKYLTEKYDVDTPFKLGIRIRSMPLLIGVLKKAQRECGKSMGTIAAHIRETIESELGAAVKRFIATLVHKEPGICVVRQQCLDMNAPQLLKHVYDKFSILMEFLNELQVLHPSGGLMKVTRYCRTIQDFLHVFAKDELIVRLFHFVVCCSNQDMHIQLSDILATEYQQLKPLQQADERSRKELPPVDKVVRNMRKYLERCLGHGALSLANLARVEEKLIEDFVLPHFTDLGRGSFLQFLHDNNEIKQFLDECGGMTLGGSSVGTAAESAFHPSLNVLLEFVHQSCMATNIVQHCSLEGALCNHYRVKEVKSLGHGSVAHLVTSLEKQAKQNQESIVFYEGALCTVKTVFNTAGQVGPLGHVTKEKALACLQSCPLLENMSEWSHWEVVFKPELGDLKDFVHKYGGVRTILVDTNDGSKLQMMTNILALETSPGTLLRISSNTTPEAFATAAAVGDVAATCGHLVSLVVANRGMSNTPQALLANHMMTALLKINGRHSQQVSETPDGDDSGSCDVAQFVLDCLVKMPLIICEAIANQVLLEPLTKVVGSAKSKALLLRLADSGPAQTRLQLLGWLLGLADWAKSFQARCNPPSEDVTTTHDNSFDDTVEVLESSDESEDDHEDDDTILVLSDEDDDVVEKRDGVTTYVDVIKTELIDGKMRDETVIRLSDTDDDNMMLNVSADVVVKDEVKGDIEGIVCLDDNPCWTLVEQIRRDEFGIGVALGEDGERLMRKQQERLGRSLDRLSRDLYSKDTHFVLELIQNADDNSYPPEMLGELATTVPSVKFVVESDCITVFNNECGFEEKNIRAVCDVGRSTKGKHKYGYIGQKGIGFKSVFRVTDRPEIHSNGFHICFDVKSSPMGYILPHWVDDNGRTKDDNSWKTRIELPLKDEMRNQTQCRSLAARFHDVHPSLLLFLHRLKHLTVHNTVEGVTMNIERRDLGNRVVEIRHDNNVDRWLVVKHTLDASAISLQAKSGVEVESTEVALAFPLSNQRNTVQTQPDKQRVFAYLPLRSYGFRFVIQGDFDVPSSREDVDRDSMWNQWLRSEIHSLFVDALQQFKAHPEFSEIEAVRYFIQFIPLEDEILEFFRPVASAILQQLRSEPCLPTEVASGTGIRWKMPSQLVLTKDPLVRDVISSSLLRANLGLDFLHKDVAVMLNPSLMQSLGIQMLTTSHLIEIGKVIVSRLTNPLLAARQAAVVDVAKWLACVYRSLDEFDYNEELMARLKAVVMVPLITGEVVSLATTTVFFPIDSVEQLRLSKTKTEGPLTALMCDLRMLLPIFLGALDNISNSQLSSLLEKLGVKHLQPQEIIQHHIMPTLRSDQWQKRTERLLIGYIVYLKQQWDQNKSVVNMNELRPVAVVMTQKGPRRPADEPVHFSRLYGNKINLPKELPGYDWQLLHDCYQKSGGSHWREFFIELGVLDFLSVREKVVTITPSELESTPWAVYKAMLPTADEYKITDYECVEFATLAHSCSAATRCVAMHHQMQTLFALLDPQWDTKYSKYTVTQITDGHGYVLRPNVDTSFAILLKSSPWLPTCVMCISTANNKFTVTQSREIKMGRHLFVRVPAISHLLGDHVPYLEATPAPKSSFPQFLGIQNSIKVEFVVGLLKGWCERKSPGGPRLFNTSMEHIKAIYRYLFDNMPPKQLQDLVHDCPLIFIPSVRPPDGSTKVDGAFLGRNELRWDDPSNLFAGYRESLAGSDSADAYRLLIRPVYQDMEDFFLQCARVTPAPELTDYAQLLVHIAITVPLPKALPDVLRIFTIIGHMFAREPDLVKVRTAELTRVLQTSSGPIPVKGSRWVALSSHPMIVDDKATERLFQGKEGVNFVDLGERLGAGTRGRNPATDGIDRDLVLRCLRELGVYPLSECLTVDYQTEMYQPCPELQQYVHNVLPLVQVLLCNEFQAVYADLVAGNIAEKIKAMRFVKVGRLELVYSLKHKPDMVAVLNEKCRLVHDQELCVHRDHVTSFNEVNKELARYFSRENMQCRNEIRDLLLELLPLVVNPSSELQQFVKQRRLDDLPETEERWQVEEPVFYHHPPHPHAPQQFEEIMSVDEGHGQQEHGNHDNSGGLKAWPPRSGDPDLRQRGGPSGGGGRQMWPPPAPPEGVDYTALPASLRPSKLPSVKQEGTTSHHHSDGSHVSRPRGEGATKTEGEPGHMTRMKGIKREPLAEGDANEKQMGDENEMPADAVKQANVPNVTVTDASSGDTSQVVPVKTEGAEQDVGESDEIVTPPKKRRRSETFDVLHQRAFIDSAVWLQDSETPYEHIDIGTLILPEGMTPADGEHNAEVGRWGEQLVYSYLSQAARDGDSRIVSVSWINENQETGDPFDFVVMMKNSNDPSKDLTVFIEVKSTASDTKNFFEMSLQQIDFAREKTEAFHLYRVFNAGHQAAVRLMRLENLALKLERKEVRLCMFV